MSQRIAPAAALFLFFAPIAFSQNPEPPADAAKKKAPDPKSVVYDEKADAKADIAAALARAKRDNKRVLIQWGANWCSWCKLLHASLQSDKEIAKAIFYEYEVVRVDVGGFDKNLDLAASFGAKLKESGIPYLTLLDADGKALANQDTGSLELADKQKPGHDRAKILDLLAKNQAPQLDAQKALDSALARAQSEKKRVFLHFGAPWCGWCRTLEAWLAEPLVATALAKDFIDVKIDIDRMKGGADVQARFPQSKEAGIPWFAILDGDGKTLSDSGSGQNNIGFPAKDEEISRFIAMLEASRKSLTAEDLAAIRKSLVARQAK